MIHSDILVVRSANAKRAMASIGFSGQAASSVNVFLEPALHLRGAERHARNKKRTKLFVDSRPFWGAAAHVRAPIG
jgi:hypothetical protein